MNQQRGHERPFLATAARCWETQPGLEDEQSKHNDDNNDNNNDNNDNNNDEGGVMVCEACNRPVAQEFTDLLDLDWDDVDDELIGHDDNNNNNNDNNNNDNNRCPDCHEQYNTFGYMIASLFPPEDKHFFVGCCFEPSRKSDVPIASCNNECRERICQIWMEILHHHKEEEIARATRNAHQKVLKKENRQKLTDKEITDAARKKAKATIGKTYRRHVMERWLQEVGTVQIWECSQKVRVEKTVKKKDGKETVKKMVLGKKSLREDNWATSMFVNIRHQGAEKLAEGAMFPVLRQQLTNAWDSMETDAARRITTAATASTTTAASGGIRHHPESKPAAVLLPRPGGGGDAAAVETMDLAPQKRNGQENMEGEEVHPGQEEPPIQPEASMAIGKSDSSNGVEDDESIGNMMDLNDDRRQTGGNADANLRKRPRRVEMQDTSETNQAQQQQSAVVSSSFLDTSFSLDKLNFLILLLSQLLQFVSSLSLLLPKQREGPRKAVQRYVDMYDEENYQACLRILEKSFLQSGKSRDAWARDLYLCLRDNPTDQWVTKLNQARKKILELVYKMVDTWVTDYGLSEEYEIAMAEVFEHRRLERIFSLALPMDKAQSLYAMRRKVVRPDVEEVGLPWLCEMHTWKDTPYAREFPRDHEEWTARHRAYCATGEIPTMNDRLFRLLWSPEFRFQESPVFRSWSVPQEAEVVRRSLAVE